MLLLYQSKQTGWQHVRIEDFDDSVNVIALVRLE